jgi:alkylhydroperoxidase family enzyme
MWGDRVYRYRSFDLNVGAVVGDDQVLVIDTRGWRAQADELRRDLRRLSPLPWRQVINTQALYSYRFQGAIPAQTKEAMHVAVSMANKCDF